MIGRREFITLLGGAAAWPLVARAQQPTRRITVLLANSDGGLEGPARLQGLLRGLQQLGWSNDRNLRIDVWWADGSLERTDTIVAELVALAPDVIVSSGSVATAAMKRATASIPVVFVLVNEPDTQGFVASLARPGGNTTGFSAFDPEIVGKWMEAVKRTWPFALHMSANDP